MSRGTRDEYNDWQRSFKRDDEPDSPDDGRIMKGLAINVAFGIGGMLIGWLMRRPSND